MIYKNKEEILRAKRLFDIAEMLYIVKIMGVDLERGVNVTMHERFADYLDRHRSIPTAINLNMNNLSTIIIDYISENPDLENKLHDSSVETEDLVLMTACIADMIRLLEREYTLEDSGDLI